MDMNQQAAIEELLTTLKRCAILGFLRYAEGGIKKEGLEDTPAIEFIQASIEGLEMRGETPQNEIQWHAYGMRLMDKHGYPQEARDELMAFITGLRGGV